MSKVTQSLTEKQLMELQPLGVMALGMTMLGVTTLELRRGMVTKNQIQGMTSMNKLPDSIVATATIVHFKKALDAM